MQVTTRPVPFSASAPQPAPAPAPAPTPPPQPEKLQALDSFATGATRGGNFANAAIGAYNGGIAGLVTGGAIGLGGSALSTGIGLLKGTTQFSLSTALHTAGTTGGLALGGAAIGALAGGFAARGIGKAVGNLGAHQAEKHHLPASVGRAVGTIGTGVVLGGLAGLSVMGWNGAIIAAGCGLVGGGVSYLKS